MRRNQGNAERRLRDLDLGTAARVFSGPVVTWPDTCRDYDEARMIALGGVDGRVLVVVYTDRDLARRIISARPAKQREREPWQSVARP
ncbi:MAG TPA: BrnT family toxin [Microvirga sp.]|nr:BrnT family toxin [Microvirga sp.]